MNRRLHLSKTKHSKFNESGQLAVFYLFSFIWGCSILTAVCGRRVSGLLTCTALTHSRAVSPPPQTGGLCNKSHFPLGGLPSHSYGVSPPSVSLSGRKVATGSSTTCPLSRFQVKFFYICQIAYWLHALPELYFQKVRKVRREKGGLGQQRSNQSWPREHKSKRILIFLFLVCAIWLRDAGTWCCFAGGHPPSALLHLPLCCPHHRCLRTKVGEMFFVCVPKSSPALLIWLLPLSLSNHV